MPPITRRRLLQYGLGAGAAMAVPWASRITRSSASAGGKLTKREEGARDPNITWPADRSV